MTQVTHFRRDRKYLAHCGRVTHICVSKIIIIGSDDGLSPGRRQAIIWTNAGILLIGSLRTKFNAVQSKFIYYLRESYGSLLRIRRYSLRTGEYGRWGWNNMVDIFLTNSRRKIIFWFKFLWNVCITVQLTISHVLLYDTNYVLSFFI